MDHTHIVSAADLERYADTRESEAIIPELVHQLVRLSVPRASECRIPYGDAVNQPGWDGIVDSDEAFGEFVPPGRSCWEIGTGRKPQDKATTDYFKRKESSTPAERAATGYVFVTPRCSGSGGWGEPAQAKWIEHRRADGWRVLRIIDGVKLANWIREFPALGRWMAVKLHLSKCLGGFTTPAEHWDLLANLSEGPPGLPPQLFLEGRDNAREALKAVFEGESRRLFLFAESQQDVFDFVAAYLQTLDPERRSRHANRCLYVSEEDAWRSVVTSRRGHVLVADTRLGLESEEGAQLLSMATARSHGVVVSLCGAWSSLGPEIVRLRSPSRSGIEAVLEQNGFSEVRARELASAGDGMLSALKRHLQGFSDFPPYATWENANRLAQAGLIGKWDANNAEDLKILERLLGKAYGEWIEPLRTDTLRSDAPLAQHDEKWRVVARGEAWNALGGRIGDSDLERFRRAAAEVLGERDPRFDLPGEERFMAAIRGKQLRHSSRLREGLAETLALLGSRPGALSSCSRERPEATAAVTVRGLLKDATWERWAGLGEQLPLLAEAAPDEFLNAVESALENLDKTPFHEVFSQEGTGIVGARNYMSGVLWGLEALAWSGDYLARVAVILADLASIDPGGQFANRPAASLESIFLPWHYQTSAPFEKRRGALEAVTREHPRVAWRLILRLLPHGHGFTSGSHRPMWRNYVPQDWDGSVLESEYWTQVEAFSEVALSLAGTDVDRLGELVDRWADLPPRPRESLLVRLGSDEVLGLGDDERLRVWEKLDDILHRHRKYAGGAWTLPEEVLAKVEAAAGRLVPECWEVRHRRLFNKSAAVLADRDGDFEEQRKQVEVVRQAAMLALLEQGGVAEALSFARSVARPHDVGLATGAVAPDSADLELLPMALTSEEEAERRFAEGYVAARYDSRGWSWVDDKLTKGRWSQRENVALLRLLPFDDRAWERGAKHLDESTQAEYWTSVVVRPYGPERDLSKAIEKLVEFGRADEAINCISAALHRGHFDAELAVRALLAVLDQPLLAARLDAHDVVRVITRLQQEPGVEPSALVKIEWNYLSFLDRYSQGSPVTLERELASNPEFFATVIALVFPSENAEGPKEPPTEQQRALAHNGYRLLHEWRRCPGSEPDEAFDAEAFNAWMGTAKRITEESGHGEVAQSRIGEMLIHAPPDPDGLWIHHAVASALNQRPADELRSGFTRALFNSRGMRADTAGREEQELATKYRSKSDALETKGYSRFASSMRQLAVRYERAAVRNAERGPFDD